MPKSWPDGPELLMRPHFYILKHFRSKKILNNLQNCSISPEDAKFKLCIFSSKETYSIPKSWPDGPEVLMRPHFYILGHFRSNKILNNCQNCSITPEDAKFKWSAVSKQILCPSLDLVDLNYLWDHIFMFWIIWGPKKSQQFSKFHHFFWRCKIQIMHIQQ